VMGNFVSGQVASRGAQDCCILALPRATNGSVAHSASYPMGTRCSFPGGKAVGA
jgi:hypothetical protein